MTASDPPRNSSSPEVFGRFRLLRRLQVRNGAEVFYASDPLTVEQPNVLVRRLLLGEAADAAARERFAEDARSAGLVQHAGVGRVLDAGSYHGRPFAVLDPLPGLDLARLGRWLRNQGRWLKSDVALWIGRRVVSVLRALHAAKDARGRRLGLQYSIPLPERVVIDPAGHVTLSTSGIWREPDRVRRAQHELAYLAPEELDADTTSRDERAQVFSVSVLLAELLIGRPLFDAAGEIDVLLAVREARLEPLTKRAASLPGGAHALLLSALARQPEQRTPSLQELERQLTEIPSENAAAQDHLRQLLTRALPDLGFSPETAKALDYVDPGSQAGGPGARPQPGERQLNSYQVAGDTQALHGRLSQMIAAVATGAVTNTDRVSVNGAAFCEVQEVEELARHLPSSTQLECEHGRPETVHIASGGLVRLLALGAIEQRTGLLLCELGAVRKEVYLERGEPTYVTSNLAGELLGEFLAARGLISRSELDMALAVLPRYNGHLGDTLAALGLMDPVEVFRQIGIQVREKLLDLFSWRGGTITYYPAVHPPASAFPLGIRPWGALDQGMRRRFKLGLEKELFRDREDAELVQNATVAGQLRDAKLPQDLRLVLTLAERPTSLQDMRRSLGDPAGKDVNKPLRAVAVLLHLDAVKWRY